ILILNMSSLFNTESDNLVKIVDVISDNNNEEKGTNSDDFIEKIAYFTKSLIAKHVQFSAVLVEYLPTDPEGYAIIYNFIESNNYSISNDNQTKRQ
ncbi:6045_t:CDS:2, partial [Gigaspora margarita]